MSETTTKRDAAAGDEAGYDHVLKATGLLGGVQVVSMLASLVRNKCTALLIGAAGMGMADLYARSCDLVGNLTSFGMGFSSMRRLAAVADGGSPRAVAHEVRLVRSWVLLAALFGLAAGLLLSPVLSLTTTGGYEATGQFALLAPVAAMATLSAGELAVLKGTRRLGRLAAVSGLGALSTLVVSVALYVWLGMRVLGKLTQENVLVLSFVACALACMYGVFQSFGLDVLWPFDMQQFASRAFSTFGNPNFLSSFVVMLLPALLSHRCLTAHPSKKHTTPPTRLPLKSVWQTVRKFKSLKGDFPSGIRQGHKSIFPKGIKDRKKYKPWQLN